MSQYKSYTDLPQSKKLAEFLPIESADMFWLVLGNTPRVHVLTEPLSNYSQWESYPCWSLAALINILPDIITDEDGTIFGLNIKKNFIEYYNPSMGALYATYHSIIAEDLVDACYEMIIKLHEQKLL